MKGSFGTMFSYRVYLDFFPYLTGRQLMALIVFSSTSSINCRIDHWVTTRNARWHFAQIQPFSYHCFILLFHHFWSSVHFSSIWVRSPRPDSHLYFSTSITHFPCPTFEVVALRTKYESRHHQFLQCCSIHTCLAMFWSKSSPSKEN